MPVSMHTVRVEPITAEHRTIYQTSADATSVVVERYEGQLVKICADDQTSHLWLFEGLTSEEAMERIAEGIAGTYGATYVPQRPLALAGGVR